jgi:hypothetical protein
VSPSAEQCSFGTFSSLSSNVEGSILGNSFSRKGRENSAKGITTMAMKGMSRNRSTVVCVSNLRSLRVKFSPLNDLDSRRVVALMF